MSRPLFTGSFWLDALERAVKTFAYTTNGLLITALASEKVDLSNWETGALVVGLTTASSVLGSVISSGIGEPGTASMLNPAPPDTLK